MTAERCAKCGAVLALVGLVHNCRPGRLRAVIASVKPEVATVEVSPRETKPRKPPRAVTLADKVHAATGVDLKVVQGGGLVRLGGEVWEKVEGYRVRRAADGVMLSRTAAVRELIEVGLRGGK